MSKIDIDKLVSDLVEIHAKRTGIDRTVVNTFLDDALAMQGLAVINNEVVVVNDRAYLNSKIERATPHWEGVDADEFIKHIRGSREYIFADEACKYVDKDPINAFEEGAEYGYKYAVEKACSVIRKINEVGKDYPNIEDFITDIIKAMEEKQ